MSASTDFDPSAYVRPPAFDVAWGVSLAHALVKNAPRGAPATVAAAARTMRSRAVELQAVWAAQTQAAPSGTTDRRHADQVVDNAWLVLHDRLDAYARLPHDDYPLAARAAELRAMIFSKGTSFINLPMEAEWAEGQRMLDVIDFQNLAADLDRACGPEFLAHLRQAHTSYGEVLGRTQRLPDAPAKPEGLQQPLRALALGIRDYALQLSAWAVSDPASVPAVKAALRPMDEHRARRARAPHKAEEGGGEAETTTAEVTPGTPMPELDLTERRHS
jgi:hypothetical protein